MDEHELEENTDKEPLEQEIDSTEQTPVVDVDSTRKLAEVLEANAEVEKTDEIAEVDSPSDVPEANAVVEKTEETVSIDSPSDVPEMPGDLQKTEEIVEIDTLIETVAPQLSGVEPEMAVVGINEEQPIEVEASQPSSEAPEMAAVEITKEQPIEVESVEDAENRRRRASSVLSSGRRSSQLAQGELPPEASSEPAWYVIHCYSGYENKVRHNLEQRIETMGMKDRIFDVVIPTQEEIEVREGKRRTVERHIFPGYVLVNMTLSEESWYVVRNTPGVTGFVGMGNLPTALRPEEVSQIVKRMEADAPMVKVSFKEGERVRIIDGPFNDFRGTVADIDLERTKVRVMVSFFGRETPVELDFLQVEKA